MHAQSGGNTVKTSFTLGQVEFKNRVLVASGTYGYGDECVSVVDISRLGGIVTKSLSLKPREGNPPPRIIETSGGMLNSIGTSACTGSSQRSSIHPHSGDGRHTNIAASTIDEYCVRICSKARRR
jgi:dihydroorotate dehydrogenase (NAD+) catalytic subunit